MCFESIPAILSMSSLRVLLQQTLSQASDHASHFHPRTLQGSTFTSCARFQRLLHQRGLGDREHLLQRGVRGDDAARVELVLLDVGPDALRDLPTLN